MFVNASYSVSVFRLCLLDVGRCWRRARVGLRKSICTRRGRFSAACGGRAFRGAPASSVSGPATAGTAVETVVLVLSVISAAARARRCGSCRRPRRPGRPACAPSNPVFLLLSTNASLSSPSCNTTVHPISTYFALSLSLSYGRPLSYDLLIVGALHFTLSIH